MRLYSCSSRRDEPSQHVEIEWCAFLCRGLAAACIEAIFGLSETPRFVFHSGELVSDEIMAAEAFAPMKVPNLVATS